MMYGYKGRDISKVVDGVKYKTPIILSAGFDYNANLIDILSRISFGGVEVGSLTARPCSGNATPRMKRLPNSRSIMVNKGLRNDGVDVVLDRIRNRKTNDLVVGISIARTNDQNTATTESGIADYVYSFKKVIDSNLGDYYTINISCPNAFGGEAFTTPELLEKLFVELDKIQRYKPIYVKMPISVKDEVFFSLLEVLDRHKVNGVIIGNLQKDYTKINKKDGVFDKYRGGLSGKPCEDRSNELILKTKQKYKNRFTLIGCGGVFSYEDFKKKNEAGAQLVHLITGMIFEGPVLIKNICEGIEKGKYNLQN